MSERAAALGEDFGRANAEAVVFARSCGADAWARPVPGEGWTVGVVLHHIAESHGNSRRWLEEMARGDGVAETAAIPAHAERAASVTPAETVSLLREGGSRLEALLRAFGDEDLSHARATAEA